MGLSTTLHDRSVGVRPLAALTAILLSLFLSTGAAAQQTGTVQGTVIFERDGAPVSGVTVQIPATGHATRTDATGRFQLINIPVGAHEIVAERLGLQRLTRSVQVDGAGVVGVRLVMAEEALLVPAVVVSATRETQRMAETTATVGVVGAAELAAAKPTHPSGIMSQIPGVWVNTTGGEGHMTAIRQPQTTKPVYLFLEDGIPTRSTGFFNHNALYEVNLPQADRVEVLKGPASALYGSDAIGGVVNVETKRPARDAQAEAYVEGGAFGYTRFLGSASNSWGSHGVRADVNLTRTDGWRDATAYDRQSATLRWDAYLENGVALRTVVTGSRIDQQTAGSSALPRDTYLADPTRNLTPISLRNVRAFRASTSAELSGDRTLVSITPFVRWNEMELLPNWSLTYDPTIYDTGHRSLGLLARVRHDFDRFDGRLIGGVDIDHSPGGRTEHAIVPSRADGIFTAYTLGDLLYDYDVTFQGVSPYLQADANLTPALHLTAGLRFDHMSYDYENRLSPLDVGRWRRPPNASRSYTHFSPKLGLAYDFGRALNVYGNYNRGFRAPSEGQLFRQGNAENTLDLEPVKADSYEMGVRGELAGRVGYSLAAYRMSVTDDILGFTHPDGTPETQNAGGTLHRGVEVGLNLLLGAGFRSDVSYSYAQHTYEEWSPRPTIDYAGNEMEAAPNTILNGRLIYQPETLDGSRFAVEWSRIGEYWLDADNTHTYEGHDLINLNATVRLLDRLEVVGRVMNVADTRYAETASFTQFRGEELAPGLPRTVYLGVQYSWQR